MPKSVNVSDYQASYIELMDIVIRVARGECNKDLAYTALDLVDANKRMYREIWKNIDSNFTRVYIGDRLGLTDYFKEHHTGWKRHNWENLTIVVKDIEVTNVGQAEAVYKYVVGPYKHDTHDKHDRYTVVVPIKTVSAMRDIYLDDLNSSIQDNLKYDKATYALFDIWKLDEYGRANHTEEEVYAKMAELQWNWTEHKTWHGPHPTERQAMRTV